MTAYTNRFRITEHLGFLGVLIGLVFWIGEALIRVYLSHNKSFTEEILSRDVHEIAVHTGFLVVIAAFGFLAQALVAKRREAEKSLEENERKHQLIFETLTDVIFSLDAQGRITYLSPQFENITGYRIKDIYGRPYMDIIDPEYHERAMEMFQQGLSGKDVPMYRMDIVAADGRRIPVEINAKTVWDSAGRPIGRIGVGRDLTQRLEVEAALRESEEKFRVLADSMPTAIMLYQNDKWTYANQAAEKISGYSAEELRTMNFWDIVHPDYRQMVQQRGQKRQQGEDTIRRYEFKIISKQGKETWVDLSGASTMLNGSPAGIISVMDITDRKIAEEALRESEAKYRSILENIREGYFELDLSGIFVFFNESLCTIFDYPRDRLLGTNVRSLIPPKSRSMIDRVMEQIRQTGLSEEIIDLDISKGSGVRGTIAMTMSAIRDSSGDITGFRGIARDVTEHKRLETQLLQAQKMEAIGTLAGGLAHDFNNLLMAIQGNISLLSLNPQASSLDPKRIENIEQCIRSGSELTRQLLGFARGGKYEVAPTDLNKLVLKTSDMFGHAKKEISVHTELQDDLWSVEVDKGQIEQVLLNLYVNAWHAMPGGGQLLLKSENLHLDEAFVRAYEAEPGRYVRISVTDTGVGMDEKTLQRVFEPFFTTRDKSQGSGLGLTSAYSIVRNHGGFISVYSEVGIGSTFNIYLPASDKTVEECEETTPGKIVTGTECVLLIDDEDMILEVGCEILEKLGYSVLKAGSGNEALQLFHEHKNDIDLVILDMIMPEIGGSEVFDRIRAEAPGVKVILSSGYSMNHDADDIMKRGCNGFIQKPFDIQTLSEKIRAVLDS